MPGITIVGAKEISAALRRLEAKDGKKVVRKAIRRALKPVQARVKALAPVATGRTKRAVKVRAGKRSRGRIALYVSIGEGDYKGDQFYAAFQEYGWKQGSRKLGGSRRQVPGKHFMKRAFDETGEAAKAEAERLILDGCVAALKER